MSPNFFADGKSCLSVDESTIKQRAIKYDMHVVVTLSYYSVPLLIL